MAPQVTSYPLVVSQGGSIEVVIRFQPTSFGTKSATLKIISNDPAGDRTLAVSGVTLEPQALASLIADAGNFGNVCLGSFVDSPLILTNGGRCTVSITNITSSGSEFLVPRRCQHTQSQLRLEVLLGYLSASSRTALEKSLLRLRLPATNQPGRRASPSLAMRLPASWLSPARHALVEWEPAAPLSARYPSVTWVTATYTSRASPLSARAVIGN